MGSFEGHWIPGVAYGLLAIWWGFVTAVRAARAEKRKRTKYHGSTTMPCFCCPTSKLRTLPIESILKVVGLTYHMYREVHDSWRHDEKDGHLYMYIENAHHICMLIGFLVGGIIEILVYLRVPLPKQVEYIFNGMAFLIQVMIMVGHTSPGLEWHLHKLWTSLIVCTFVSGILEFADPTNLWYTYLRIGFFLAQGTWLIQVAFVLWPHTTNPRFLWEDDHHGRTWMTIFLMIHIMASLITLMVQYLVVYFMIDIFDRMYIKYEMDLERGVDAKAEPITMYNINQNHEYSSLLNSPDDEGSNESCDFNEKQNA